jgi:hypothetical protein
MFSALLDDPEGADKLPETSEKEIKQSWETKTQMFQMALYSY